MASQLIEVRVPDIGDFKDVEIIEVAVQARATRSRVEATLITLETEKATMDVPSTVGGRRRGSQGAAAATGCRRAT